MRKFEISPPSFADIKEAAERIKNEVRLTPVESSRTLNAQVGAEVYFKCENFQRVGAFKFRGAFNALSALSDEQKERGVIAYSSGNHAQAVALVAQLLGIDAIIVMPDDAPAIKLAATRGYGAKVVTFDPQQTTREAVAQEIRAGDDRTLIKPFDDRQVIAGQGTATLELFQQVGSLDFLLVPCGGGGLLSGTAIAAKQLMPNCRVIGIEPETADDAYRSFKSGVLQANPNPNTIADGTRTTSLGQLTFPIIRNYVDDMVTVSEQEIVNAVKWHFLRMKLVVEPSGALPLAAILARKLKLHGKVGAIISGGNMDIELLSRLC